MVKLLRLLRLIGCLIISKELEQTRKSSGFNMGNGRETDCLQVRMLGDFSLKYKGRTISFERNILTKTNQLLQILLEAGAEGVSRAQLLKDLFGREEVTNPANSLRATVFRLRKLLLAAGLPEDDYVKIKKGRYYWTNHIPVQLDTVEFERYANAAQSELNADRRLDYLQNACDIYQGEFLPQLQGEEWAVILNIRYKDVFTKCMKELCTELKKREAYEQLYECAEKAVKLYPFEEWQIWQIDSLIAQKRHKEAVKLYGDTEKFFFEELGITPSEKMLECMNLLAKQIENNVDGIYDIKKSLREKENSKGAYYCNYPSFAESYRFIKRVIERTGQAAHLMLCTMLDTKGHPLEKSERLEAFSEELRNAIRSSLRRGDLFTKYSVNQYLILLLEINQEDCEIVKERINSYFEKSSRRNHLSYTVSPLYELEGIELG